MSEADASDKAAGKIKESAGKIAGGTSRSRLKARPTKPRTCSRNIERTRYSIARTFRE